MGSEGFRAVDFHPLPPIILKYMLILGIDEAGRGCVMGPLVLAGVLTVPGNEELLRTAGVKDSKKLQPDKRRALVPQIEKLSLKIATAMAMPDEIDEHVRRGALDRLEARMAADLIRELKPDVVYADAPGKGGRAYERALRVFLGEPCPRLVCENKADDTYPVVSAASIIAKEKREEEVAMLRLAYGDFGSGYPHDPATVKYLSCIAGSGSPMPPCVRMEWQTVKRLLEPMGPLFAFQSTRP